MTVANCWVDVPPGSPFPLHNLPFGVGRRPDGSLGAFVAIGDHALDIGAARDHFTGTAAEDGLLDGAETLNGFAGTGSQCPQPGAEPRHRTARPIRRWRRTRSSGAIARARAHDADARRRRRLRRLLLVAAPRHEPRPAVPTRRRTTAPELASPPRRLPRSVRNHRRRRHPDRPSVRTPTRRRRASLRAVDRRSTSSSRWASSSGAASEHGRSGHDR